MQKLFAQAPRTGHSSFPRYPLFDRLDIRPSRTASFGYSRLRRTHCLCWQDRRIFITIFGATNSTNGGFGGARLARLARNRYRLGVGIDSDKSDEYFLVTTDFLTPTCLLRGIAGGDPPIVLKRMPAFFRVRAWKQNSSRLSHWTVPGSPTF